MIRLPRALSLALAPLALGALAAAPTATQASAASSVRCDDLTSSVRQLVQPKTQTSLLTQWAGEARSASEKHGFTDDRGVIARVSNTRGAGLVPIWRLYKGGDFVWAADGSRVQSYVNQGFSAQFVAFYAAAADNSCLAPIYQMHRGSVHRMATEVASQGLIKDGWVRDQVGFWAAPADAAPAPSPTPTSTPSALPSPTPSPTQPTATSDTKFTIAVLPDTQNEVLSASDKRFPDRAAWLVDHKKSLDLRFAVQVGDLVNWGNVAPQQFDNVSRWMKPLEAKVPWAGVVGNHDTAAVCVGGSACPGAKTWETVRDTSAYDKAFPVSRFPGIKGTYEAGKVDNAYQEFSAGGKKWMVLSLELWPRKGVVHWAEQVVAAHPDDNVIVATHSYLGSDGSISGSNGGYGATSPQYLYDNVIKQYPNIKMVLSGHVGKSAVRTDKGVHGNKIVSLLQCYHSTSDPVRLVEIDTAAGTIKSKVYVPMAHKYYPNDATSTSGMSFTG